MDWQKAALSSLIGYYKSDDEVRIKGVDYYKEAAGAWRDYDGGEYESVIEIISVKVLGFCDCVPQPDIAIYVMKSLELVQEVGELGREKQRNKASEFFGSLGAEYFMYNWLASAGYTEHGGGLPGWLTHEGKELLGLLRRASKEYKGQEVV